MNETLVFLISGVISALISAMVCLLFRLWDSRRAKCDTVQRPSIDTPVEDENMDQFPARTGGARQTGFVLSRPPGPIC